MVGRAVTAPEMVDEFRCVTDGAVTATLAKIRLDFNDSLILFGNVFARRLDSGGVGQVVHWGINALIQRITGGTPAVDGAWPAAGSSLTYSTAGAASVALDFNAAGDAILQVTGVAGTRLEWSIPTSDFRRC